MSYCRAVGILLSITALNFFCVAHADESEIYFGSAGVLTNTRPNVLFLLDESGSMSEQVIDESVTSGTKYNGTRIQNLKHAMYSILESDDIKKTNVGIIKFSYWTTEDSLNMINGSEVFTYRNLDRKAVTVGDMVTFSHYAYDRWESVVDEKNPEVEGRDTIYADPSYEEATLLKNNNVYFGYRFSNVLLNNYNLSGLNDPTHKGIEKVELRLAITKVNKLFLKPEAMQYKVFMDQADDAPHFDTLSVIRSTLRKRANVGNNPYVLCTYDYNLPARTWVSCDVTELVRQKISSPGWKAGKAMAFYIYQQKDINNPIALNVYNNWFRNPLNIHGGYPEIYLTVNKKLIVENTASMALRFEDRVSHFDPDGGTAIVPAMLAGAKFISNKPQNNGNKGPYHYSDYKRPSPLEKSCQGSHLVLMTDGQTNQRAGTVQEYINSKNCTVTKDGVTYKNSKNLAEDCGRALAYWLATTPQGTFEDNYITTHTIALGTDLKTQDKQFLIDLAKLGNGGFYYSNDVTSLTEAFSDIIYKAINAGSPAMSGQVISSSASKYNQRKEAYYTIFTSKEKDYWSGNLKGFYLDYVDLVLPSGFVSRRPVLKDKTNNQAVLNSSGTFIEGTSSFWSAGDASTQAKGGVVEQLAEPDKRNLYTRQDGSGQIIELKPENSAQFTDAQLGTNNEKERKALLNFARGYVYADNASTPIVAEKKIADGSRALAALATYGCDNNSTSILKCSTNNLKQLALFPSNDGVLRAFDLRSGKNLYEFMPVELLSVINKMHNQKGVGRDIMRTYGLDGTVKIQHDDTNKNDYIDDGEKAYAFVTAGRGGRFFYILDVSSFTNTKPEVVKVINNASAGFSKLGYTWSVPASGKIKVGNDTKNVFIFGGGYDPKQDDTTARASDTMGNALYIINAENGNMIWSSDTAGTNMSYSIPASPSVLVDETTGLITDIVVGDMGGQLWRFGVNNGSTGTSLITKAGNNGVVATIASNSAGSSRRFYVTPQLYTMLNPVTGIKSLSVSIGSGYFGHPLNKEITDKLYVFFLPKVAAAGTVIDESLLGKATSSTTNTATPSITANGFYVTLGQDSKGQGEKVITDLKADFKRVVFNTYVPNIDTSLTNNSCIPVSGKQRSYVYSLLTGKNMLQSEYVETLIPGLPSDVALYCSGRACTFITSGGELSKDLTLPVDKDGNYVTNILRCGPGSDHPQCTYGLGWSDLFDPQSK